MRVSPRLLLTVVAVSTALVAVGCGDSKDDSKTTTAAETTAAAPQATLDEAAYQALNTGAQTLSTSLTAIGTSATECSKEASEGAEAVQKCVAGKLDDANAGLEKLAADVEASADKVEGTCKTQLTAFATELRAVVKTFGDGAKKIASGDLQGGANEVKNIDVSGLTTAGNAAQTSCKPGAAS